MSIDLNFWKYEDGVSLNSGEVYQKACCDGEAVEGLAALPTADILQATAAAFPDWTRLDPYHYEGRGSFQISVTPQTVRFDCYSMEQTDMKRFSALLAGFGCPLYDPQAGVRFDRLCAFLVDEAGVYAGQVERAFSRLLPRLEFTSRTVTWEEYQRLSKDCPHIHYNAIIHRAKTMTKAVSFMKFGTGWANRPCSCRTAQLADPEQARQVLSGLLETSIERVVQDFLSKTYYA